MKKIYITYADGNFLTKMPFALRKAKVIGGFDRAIGYTKSDIDQEFFDNNKEILSKRTGAGYWLWKSYFIYTTLENMAEGDILFYADVGSFFCQSIDNIIDDLKVYDQSVMAFNLPLIELQWTTKQLFKEMGCDKHSYQYSNQLNGSFHLVRKSKKSIAFYKELLDISCVQSNLTGEFYNKSEEDKYFVEHRYDQSVFSLLYKKHGYIPFKDPTQFGVFEEGYTGSNLVNTDLKGVYLSNKGRLCRKVAYKQKYNCVIFHNRNTNPRVSLLKFKLKLFWSKIKFF